MNDDNKNLLVGFALLVAVAWGYIHTSQQKLENLNSTVTSLQTQQNSSRSLIKAQEAKIEASKAQLEAQEKKIAKAQKEAEMALKSKSSNGLNISEIDPYLSGVVLIGCATSDGYSFGSGSLVIVNEMRQVMTNKHVIANATKCGLWINNKGYNLDLNYYYWNENSDSAMLEITSDYSDLNFSITYLHTCKNTSVGSSVVIVGFPKYSQNTQSVTTGIVSGLSPGIYYDDYFVSAKMDSGNSGGMAFSKDSDGICMLGLPTWVSQGNYENIGVVQNIQNVINK